MWLYSFAADNARNDSIPTQLKTGVLIQRISRLAVSSAPIRSSWSGTSSYWQTI